MSRRKDGRKPARPTPPNPSPAVPAAVPAGSKPAGSRGWLWPVVGLFLVGACILAGLAMTRHREAQTASPSEPVPTESISPAVTNPPLPPPVVETNAAPDSNSVVSSVATVPPRPRLQGIVSDPVRPWAIVDGKTVYPGDRVGDFRVKEISKGTLTLEDTNGSRQVLLLGK